MSSNKRLVLLLLLAALAALLVYWLAGDRSPRPQAREAPHAPAVGATVPDRPIPRAHSATPGSEPAPRSTEGTVVLRGRWGSAPGQFGHRQAQESNPEGPMGLALGRHGELLLLDQVNRRVQRFDREGKLLNQVSIGSDTAQDLALDRAGNLLVLDRLGTPGVEVYDASGTLRTRLPVLGGPLRTGGAITGLFSGPGGIYVESEHDDLVQIAGADGQPVPLEQTIPGRPTRDGKLLIKAGVINKAEGKVYVQAHRPDKTLAWECSLGLPLPLLHLLLLDSDLAGRVYLGAEVGQEQPGGGYQDLATVVAQISADGQLLSSIKLPPTTAQPEESFRPLAVGDDGTVYHMVVVNGGVKVTAYSFPQ